MFRHVIRSDAVDIEAPIERVWEVLTDFERYGEWNPFTTRVDANLEVGASVSLHVVYGPFRLRPTARIEIIEPPTLLVWGVTMGASWLLTARREQRLDSLDESRCRYRTTDSLNGVLTPLIVLLYGRAIRRGFNAMAVALKARASGY